jgi:hypothetical protein
MADGRMGSAPFAAEPAANSASIPIAAAPTIRWSRCGRTAVHHRWQSWGWQPDPRRRCLPIKAWPCSAVTCEWRSVFIRMMPWGLELHRITFDDDVQITTILETRPCAAVDARVCRLSPVRSVRYGPHRADAPACRPLGREPGDGARGTDAAGLGGPGGTDPACLSVVSDRLW